MEGISYNIMVTKPIDGFTLDRVRSILDFMRSMKYEHLLIEYRNGEKNEFVQVISGKSGFHAEYSHMEEGRQIIRSLSELTIEQTMTEIEYFSTVPEKEIDVSAWRIEWQDNESDSKDDEEEDGEAHDDNIDIHIHPDCDDDTEMKRYLSFGRYPEFKDSIIVTDRDDTTSIGLVVDQDDFTEQELDTLQKLFTFTVQSFHHWKCDIDGIQIAISNDEEGEVGCQKVREGCYHIHLAVESLMDECQTIYQLGYTFSECVIDYCFASKAPWIEETVCQMMSIMLLSRFAAHCDRFELLEDDQELDTHLREYVTDYILSQKWTSAIADCREYEDLQKLNTVRDEKGLVLEVISLYYMTSEDQIRSLLNYAEYLNAGTFLLDGSAIQNETGLRYLYELQQRILDDGSEEPEDEWFD